MSAWIHYTGDDDNLHGEAAKSEGYELDRNEALELLERWKVWYGSTDPARRIAGNAELTEALLDKLRVKDERIAEVKAEFADWNGMEMAKAVNQLLKDVAELRDK